MQTKIKTKTKTFECCWYSEDKMEVTIIGEFIHFNTSEDADDVVLCGENLIELRNMIDEALAAYAPAAEPEAPKPQGYSALNPLAKKVYQHMQRAGSISAREAMADHGITSASLARRICDIEAAGFPIKRDRRTHPLSNQRYTRYSLA